MKTIAIAGNVGKDAECKNASGNDFCSFSVAVDDGWGDSKSTMWFDVTRWGKGAQGLAKVLVKGSRVAVSGELTTREHNGKTYLQVRADKVSILSTPQGGNQRRQAGAGSDDWGRGGDDDSEIPF